ncbi:Protein N-acetyltransferase, RimJ/RimL family [Salinihabitans flavidus]|uniref:Protein N-acetyltransferase, RimJ/RimL family n=1 Tax=Salinihabitans flavidus TaxID=569882 RepID=A0A1H8UQZ0_9RHOB|nr:GNAT family N-acetyltransferase [Salinihabitans flavidus]SEP05334.1 Protein N-acetyltransferase, RimJ/RimL family [Salinihabitans flavidus]
MKRKQSQMRKRSDGPLSRDDRQAHRRDGLPIAYDPLQMGWVPAEVLDDLRPSSSSWRARAQRLKTGEVSGPAAGFGLRRWRQEDARAFRALLDNPNIWTHLPDPYTPISDDAAATLIDLSNRSNHHEVRAVIHEGTIVGQVRLVFAADTDDTAEISYWLGEDHWGRGYGTAIVQLYTAQSFAAHPGITALIARVHQGNVASRRVLEKAGYTCEGLDPSDPDHYIYRISR